MKKLISRFLSQTASYQGTVEILNLSCENNDKNFGDLALTVISLKLPNHNVKSMSEFRAYLETNLKILDVYVFVENLNFKLTFLIFNTHYFRISGNS